MSSGSPAQSGCRISCSTCVILFGGIGAFAGVITAIGTGRTQGPGSGFRWGLPGGRGFAANLRHRPVFPHPTSRRQEHLDRSEWLLTTETANL